MHPSRRNSTVFKSPSLIHAQYFEFINAASPKVREPQQQAKNETAVFALGYEAFRMKVCNAVDEMLPEQEIERRDEMQHQRRAAGKENRIRLPHRPKCSAQQEDVGDNRPDEPCYELLFLIGMAMDPKYLERAIAYSFHRLPVRWPAGQSDQRHRPALARPLAREQDGILTHRAKIWRKPVADIDEPLRHRVMLSNGKSAPRR